MNRREFTLLLGTSLSQIVLQEKSVKPSEMLTEQNIQLNEIRTFWFENIAQNPENHLKDKNVNNKNFKKIKQYELKNGQILEFQGVYFSHTELALLASLAHLSA